MLQISSVGRGFRGLGDAKDDAITLQLAANRYAKEVGKTPLATDGAIGSLTLSMVQAALKFLVTKNVSAATAQGLAAKLTTTTQLTTSAVGVGTFLNDSMDTIRLAATQTPGPAAPTPPTVSTAVPTVPRNWANPWVPFPGAQTKLSTAQTTVSPPTMQLPVTAIVGVAPSAKKYVLIAGAALVGILVLKKLL